jgi:glutamyl-tRNA synthetase
MLQHFTLERVNKAPASFDPEKLAAFQTRAMQQLPIKQRVARTVPFLQRAGFVSDPPPCDLAPYLTRLLEAAGDRVKVAGDILDFDDFFVSDESLMFNEAAIEKRLRKPPDAIDLITAYNSELAGVEPFTPETLERMTHTFVESKGIKIGDIVHAIRVAVTGKPVGFGLFDTLAILGRERCTARITRALEIAAGERTLNSGTI